MTRRSAVLLLSAGTMLSACRVQQAGTDWEPAAVRAVARHVEAAEPHVRLMVLGTVGASGAELPWGVRQTLTTAGFEVVGTATARAPGTALLVFESTGRSNGAWIMDTRLEHDTRATIPVHARWRVRCAGDACDIAELLSREQP